MQVIKLPFAIKIFVLSNFEWTLKIGFTVDCLAKDLSAHWCQFHTQIRLIKQMDLSAWDFGNASKVLALYTQSLDVDEDSDQT